MHTSAMSSPTLDNPPSAMLPPTTTVDPEVDLEVLTAVPKRFSIENENSANWLVRRVQSARLYAQSVKDWAAQELRRAEREEQTLLFLFGRQLEEWTKSEIEKLGGRRKSLCLPAGTVAFRHENPKLVVDDESAVIVWARTNLPEAIKKTEHLQKAVLNQHFESSGELPDSGVHVEPAREKFSIK